MQPAGKAYAAGTTITTTGEAMSAVGQRGKWAEGKVGAWMKARNLADARFAFNRYPDARAGSLQTAPADFEATHRGTPYKIEVKEVTIPETRKSRILPEKNFSADKVGRMAKWQMAGDTCWVIICHLPMKEWRLVPLSVFQPPRPASWDVGAYPAFAKLDDLMMTIFGAIFR